MRRPSLLLSFTNVKPGDQGCKAEYVGDGIDPCAQTKGVAVLTVGNQTFDCQMPRGDAADKPQWAFMGVGAETCAQFANEYPKNPAMIDLVFFSWAQGYMSAMNNARDIKGLPKKDLNSMDTGEQRRLLRDYCDKHPLAEYATAIPPLMDRFTNMVKDSE